MERSIRVRSMRFGLGCAPHISMPCRTSLRNSGSIEWSICPRSVAHSIFCGDSAYRTESFLRSARSSSNILSCSAGEDRTKLHIYLSIMTPPQFIFGSEGRVLLSYTSHATPPIMAKRIARPLKVVGILFFAAIKGRLFAKLVA